MTGEMLSAISTADNL